MSYTILWTHSADKSYIEELEFIYKKWNANEVILFEELVEKELVRLTLNPFVGKYDVNYGLQALVISKQTTLFYEINENQSIIDLRLFWNNLKNPKDLSKLL